MTLYEQINEDIKIAMKAKEKEKLEALRYLKAMLMENNTSTKPVAEMDVLVKHSKKLKDSISNYPDGHAAIAKIEAELNFIAVYLPAQLSEEAVVAMIAEIKASLPNPNMGLVMKELTPKIKGQFDGKRASDLVKAACS